VDACQTAPPTAEGGDESVFAVANVDSHAAILNLPVSRNPIAVEQVFDSFSGVRTMRPGMLLTITGKNLAAGTAGLGLKDSDPLPTELARAQVLFDGIAAQMVQAAPDRLICVVPDGIHDPVKVQVTNGGQSGTPFLFTPVTSPLSIGAVLTNSFPSRPPIVGADGAIQNADGSLNDAAHPAALGSTVTLYVNATGLPAGPVNLTWGIPNISDLSCNPSRMPGCPQQSYVPGIVSPLPGFISVVYQIQVTLPSTLAPSVNHTTLPSGVKRVDIGLTNTVGIYVQ
jgi:uncharacterized protein (TIGR03437 family)